MLKRLISCLLASSLMLAISLVTACEKAEIKEYMGEVVQLSEYEGNYSILVKVDKEDFTDGQLSIGLNSDMELVNADGETVTADKFVENSKITFYADGENLLLSYPPILNGVTKIVLETEK